jgi:hypothetical protein
MSPEGASYLGISSHSAGLFPPRSIGGLCISEALYEDARGEKGERIWQVFRERGVWRGQRGPFSRVRSSWRHGGWWS